MHFYQIITQKVGLKEQLTRLNKRAIVALNRSPVDFSHSQFPLISLCKTIDPRIRTIFGPRAII